MNALGLLSPPGRLSPPNCQARAHLRRGFDGRLHAGTQPGKTRVSLLGREQPPDSGAPARKCGGNWIK